MPYHEKLPNDNIHNYYNVNLRYDVIKILQNQIFPIYKPFGC